MIGFCWSYLVMVRKSGSDPASTNPWFDGFNVGIFRTPTNLEGKMIRWIHSINEGLFFFEHRLFFWVLAIQPQKKNHTVAPTNWGHRFFHVFDGPHPKVLKASSLLKGGIFGWAGKGGNLELQVV